LGYVDFLELDCERAEFETLYSTSKSDLENQGEYCLIAQKTIQKTQLINWPILKIAIFTSLSVLPPVSGTEKLIFDTAIELGKRKHKVIVVSLAVGSKGISSVTRIKEAMFAKVPLRNPLHQLLAIIRFVINHVFPALPFVLLWIYPTLFKLGEIESSHLLTDHYDAFLCEDPRVFPTVLKLSKKTNTPIVYRLHSIQALINTRKTPFTSSASILTPVALKISKTFEERALKESDVVLTLSLNDSKVIKKIYDINSKYIGIGYNVKECQADDTFIKQNALELGQYLLYVSSYSAGIDTIIKAAEALPKYRFVLVGKASTLVNAYNAPSNIVSLGVVSENVLEALYKYAKIVLVPISWSPGLGVPVKLVEALAHGKPAIVSFDVSRTLPGIRHLKNAIIFNTFSEMLKGIELVFNDYELEKTLAQEAKMYAIENLSWTTIVGNLEKVLGKAVFERPSYDAL
jgi:glycosyltransferase involved in cell wall biosynthesis